jgi:hypothetical protein
MVPHGPDAVGWRAGASHAAAGATRNLTASLRIPRPSGRRSPLSSPWAGATLHADENASPCGGAVSKGISRSTALGLDSWSSPGVVGPGSTLTFERNIDTVKVGFNYRFGGWFGGMYMAEERDVPLAELEALGFTHVVWTCLKCGSQCSRGFRLLRIRGQVQPETTIARISDFLNCARCHIRPEARSVFPGKR